MNKLLLSAAFCACFATASAQSFRPEIVNGAVLGGIAGAILGNNSGHHNGGQGALIGAAAGAILGGIAGNVHRDQTWGNTQVRAPRHHRVYRPTRWEDYDYYDRRIGAGYAHPRHHGYRHSDYGYRYGDAGDRYGNSGDRALGGALFGGLAGAIIGNNSGRGNGARGAAIGAVTGLILGSIADDVHEQRVYTPADRRLRSARYYEPVPSEQPAPAAAAPQQVTIINNYYATPASMAAANTLFGR